MTEEQQPEFWLRGPVNDIIAVLQPAAHAILQARLEVQQIVKDFPETLLWQRPAGVASVAFHLQHLAGVLDRLFTYAKGEPLSQQQLMALQKEGKEDETVHLAELLLQFNNQVDKAILQLSITKEDRSFRNKICRKKKNSFYGAGTIVSCCRTYPTTYRTVIGYCPHIESTKKINN